MTDEIKKPEGEAPLVPEGKVPDAVPEIPERAYPEGQENPAPDLSYLDWMLSEEQAARLILIDQEKMRTLPPSQLRLWRHRKTGPPFVKTKGSGVKYRYGDLLAWLSQITIDSTTGYPKRAPQNRKSFAPKEPTPPPDVQARLASLERSRASMLVRLRALEEGKDG